MAHQRAAEVVGDARSATDSAAEREHANDARQHAAHLRVSSAAILTVTVVADDDRPYTTQRPVTFDVKTNESDA